MNISNKKKTKTDNELQAIYNRLPREKQLELFGLAIDKRENNTVLVKKILWLSGKDVLLRALSYTGFIIMLAHTYMFYNFHHPIKSMFFAFFATGILLLDMYVVLYIITIIYFNITKRQDLGFTN